MTDHAQDQENLIEWFRQTIEQGIPFNKELGMQIESLNSDKVSLRINMQDRYVGNPFKGILHGGVISSVLDVAGGLAAGYNALESLPEKRIDALMKRMTKLGTIDLRVDYLRPGRGQYFLASATILRAGNKVVVTRMEFHNDQGLLIAVGTGSYIVG